MKLSVIRFHVGDGW